MLTFYWYVFVCMYVCFMEDNFSTDQGHRGVEGWFGDNSSALNVLCTLSLLLLHQLHLGSSGIRFWRLETPDLEDRKQLQ